MRPEIALPLFALVAGLALVVLTPPLEVADESRHLNRSYMIASGHLLAQERNGWAGNPVPLTIDHMEARLGPRIAVNPGVKQDYNRLRAEFDVELHPEQTAFVRLPSRYPPITYLPQALAILAVGWLEPPPVVLLYASRLANLLAFIVLMVVTIRLAPSHRWLMVLLALSPMSISIAASVSADAMTNALAFLLIAFVFNRRAAGRWLTTRDVLLLWLLATLIGLCKFVYWPLAALAFLLPGKLFESNGRRALVLLLVLAGSLLPTVLWYAMAASWPVPPQFEWYDPDGQMRFLKSNPSAFPAALVKSVGDRWRVWIESFVGILGWMDLKLPLLVYVAYMTGLPVAAVLDNPTPGGLSRWNRALLFALPVGCWIGIMFASYVAWTPVGSPGIAGFQGRYLIPLAPLALLAMQRAGGSRSTRGLRWGLTGLVAATLVVTIAAVVVQYHVGA